MYLIILTWYILSLYNSSHCHTIRLSLHVNFTLLFINPLYYAILIYYTKYIIHVSYKLLYIPLQRYTPVGIIIQSIVWKFYRIIFHGSSQNIKQLIRGFDEYRNFKGNCRFTRYAIIVNTNERVSLFARFHWVFDSSARVCALRVVSRGFAPNHTQCDTVSRAFVQLRALLRGFTRVCWNLRSFSSIRTILRGFDQFCAKCTSIHTISLGFE